MVFTGIAGAALGALGNIGGGLFSAAGQASANAQNIQMQNMWNQQALNAQMAQHAQNTAFQEDAQAHDIFTRHMGNEWSERMNLQQQGFNEKMFWANVGEQYKFSNTAYQRAMADMRAAGLNPILAYQQGGASTPSPGAPSSPGASPGSGSGISASSSGGGSYGAARAENVNEGLNRAIGNAVSSAVDVMRTAQGIDLMKEQEQLTRQKERESKAAETNINQDTLRKVEETRRTKGEADNTTATGDLIKAQTHSAGARAAVDANAARVYGKYDSPTAPTLWERIGRIIQDAVERGQVPASVNQYVPSAPSLPTPNGAPSDFWGTSERIKERARYNRERYK